MVANINVRRAYTFLIMSYSDLQFGLGIVSEPVISWRS